jgi:hypothetical protein
MIANHVEVTLLAKYLADENDRRRFVDGMAEVKVKQEEVIMRQGALCRRPACCGVHARSTAARLEPLASRTGGGLARCARNSRQRARRCSADAER